MTDEQVVERIRQELAAWAHEQPVAEPRPTGSTLVRLDTVRIDTATDHQRRNVVWLVAAVAAVTVAVLGAVVLNRNGDTPEPVQISPGPATTTEIPVGAKWGVRGLAVTDDAVWVTSHFDQQLYRVDPLTNRVVATFDIPDHVEGVLAAGGWLWLIRYEPGELVRIDPASGAITGSVAFESEPGVVPDGDRLWVVASRDGGPQAVEVATDTLEEIRAIPLESPAGWPTLDGDRLWYSSADTNDIVEVDLPSGQVVNRFDVGGEPRDVVVVDGSVWVAVNSDAVGRPGSVVRIDPVTGEITASIATGRFIQALAVDGDTIWATNFDDGTLSVIDAGSAELSATTPIGDRPGGVAIGHGSVWVTPHRRAALVRVDRDGPLEPAAQPDVERVIDAASGNGVMYVRCSGHGSPTVVLEADHVSGVSAWAVVEARLSRRTRVCSYDRVGIADPTEAGQAGSAATIAADLDAALAEVGETGPFIAVGKAIGALYAQMFAATQGDDVLGLVLVDPVSPDYFDRVRPLLSTDELDAMDADLATQPELRWFTTSADLVASLGRFGDLPTVVVADTGAGAGTGDAAIDELRETTQREQAARSTRGTFVRVGGPVTPDDVVAAVEQLLGG